MAHTPPMQKPIRMRAAISQLIDGATAQAVRLERLLATRMIHRSTRSSTLTEEGQLFYEHAVRILCEVEDASDRSRGVDRYRR